MWKIILALLAVSGPQAFAGPVPPISCPNCILNTASPQDAQINIGTATIRGPLYVSTLNVTNFSITNLVATNITGSGAGITALNASNLASGTVPLARLAGSYTGITGVGTLAAGVWNGTVIGTQYGGTGQNFSTTGVGYIPYFSNTGVMATLAPGSANKILQSNGAAAPSWTAAPTVLGTNITAIQLANLQSGDLPSGVKATDASLVSVSGSKISGDISGNAENINGNLPLAQLEDGQLSAGVVAQTLINRVTPLAACGGPLVSCALNINSMGLIIGATQYTIPGISTNVAHYDLDNNWSHPQTSQSSWTIKSDLLVTGTLTLSNPLAVANGGTGRATLAANAIPYGLGTSAIGLLPVMGNGGLVIGTGAAPSTGTLTGTSNQVTVTNAAGKITLSTPQDIGTGSSPTFAALTLSSPLTVPNGGTGSISLTSHGLLLGHGSGALTAMPAMGAAGLVMGYGSSVDPSTGTLTGTSNEVVVTQNGSGFVLSTPQDIGTGSSPTFAALTLSSPLTVANGGTGKITLTANGVTYGNGTSALGILPAMADGGIIIGAGVGVIPTTGTFTGTTNRVTVTRNGAGIVLSGPQDLATGSSPTFAALTLTAALTVANGGTGAQTLTAHGVVLGEGTSAVTVLPAMGLAGIVVGNGTSLDASTATLQGTSNQVVVTKTASAITLSTPQDIGTGSSPTFAALTLTAALTVANGGTGDQTLTAHGIPYGAGTSAMGVLPAMGSGGIVIGNGTSIDPSTGTLTGTSNQVVVTKGVAGLTLSTPQDIGTGSSPTFAALTLTAALTVPNGGTGDQTLAAHGFLYGAGSSAVGVLPAMGSGGIIIGNGTSLDASTGTFAGTANQVVVTKSVAGLTISTPQDIGTASNPTFGTVTAALAGNALTASTATTSALPLGNGGAQISAAYTTTINDANRVLVHPGSDTTARTWGIDSYANVAYSTGTTITIYNLPSAGTLTLTVGSGSSFCWLATGGTCSTSSRTLAAPGVATAHSVSSTTWVLTGNPNLQ